MCSIKKLTAPLRGNVRHISPCSWTRCLCQLATGSNWFRSSHVEQKSHLHALLIFVCPLEAKQCWFNNWLCVTVMEIWFGHHWPCSAVPQHCHLSAFWHFYIQTWKGGLSRHEHTRAELTYANVAKQAKSPKRYQPKMLRDTDFVQRIYAIICTSDQRSELLHGLIIRRTKTRRFRNAVTMMERRPESRLSDTPRRPRRCCRFHVFLCAAVTQMSNRAAALKQWTACELLLVASDSLTVTYSAKAGRYPESKSSWWRLSRLSFILTHQ